MGAVLVRHVAGDLGHREDVDQVEEQLEGRRPMVLAGEADASQDLPRRCAWRRSTMASPPQPGPTSGFGARRIGATVATGSLMKKSTTILFTGSGFSWVRKCEVPGTMASSAFGSAAYMSTMCQRHQIVVGEHATAAGHLGQLGDVQVRLGGGHLADLDRHDLEMVDAIWGYLAVGGARNSAI